jgi:hypothetical protein
MEYHHAIRNKMFTQMPMREGVLSGPDVVPYTQIAGRNFDGDDDDFYQMVDLALSVVLFTFNEMEVTQWYHYRVTPLRGHSLVFALLRARLQPP